MPTEYTNGSWLFYYILLSNIKICQQQYVVLVGILVAMCINTQSYQVRTARDKEARIQIARLKRGYENFDEDIFDKYEVEEAKKKHKGKLKKDEKEDKKTKAQKKQEKKEMYKEPVEKLKKNAKEEKKREAKEKKKEKEKETIKETERIKATKSKNKFKIDWITFSVQIVKMVRIFYLLNNNNKINLKKR